MAVAHFTESCITCRFHRNNLIIGTCRRFPTAQNKHETDWCGEYSRIVMPDVIAETPIKIVTIETSKVIGKKRGRPAKVAK